MLVGGGFLSHFLDEFFNNGNGQKIVLPQRFYQMDLIDIALMIISGIPGGLAGFPQYAFSNVLMNGLSGYAGPFNQFADFHAFPFVITDNFYFSDCIIF